jgi:hypothetical protein
MQRQKDPQSVTFQSRLSPFKILMFLFCAFLSQKSQCQKWLVPADTTSPRRQLTGTVVIGSAYTAFSAGLYYSWYAQYERSAFHFFNDLGEWRNMDKLGHMHSAYAQTSLIYTGSRWAGMSRKKALWTGMITSLVFQSTIEVFDGYSAKWGFSVPDMVANVCGVGWFAWQEHLWGDQRFALRFLPGAPSYSQSILQANSPASATTTPQIRANALYGHHWAEQWLKDYNGQTYWLSIQIKPWLPPDSSWPDWLCLGLGFGAGNLYGGFSNQWTNDGAVFDLSMQYPRYSRFFLGPDISVRKLGLKHPLFKTLASMAQVFRIPVPCVEWNTRGEWVLHFLH